jgi:hypothetical protein
MFFLIKGLSSRIVNVRKWRRLEVLTDTCFKGTVSRDGFGVLMTCSNDFILQKVYFSRLMRVYVGLIMLVAFC